MFKVKYVNIHGKCFCKKCGIKLGTVSVKNVNGRLLISTPYSAEFVRKIKLLNGRWDSNAKVWSVDARDLDTVKKILTDIYGESGIAEDAPVKRVSVRVSLDEIDSADSAELFGYPIAKRWTRDSPVKLAPNVVVVSGGFASSGGSRKAPYLNAARDTIVEIRDIPESMAQRAVEQYGAKIIDYNAVAKPEPQSDRKEQLLMEKQQLMDRLKQIEYLLAEDNTNIDQEV